MQENLHRMEWDVATLWQLHGLFGSYWVYMAVMESEFTPQQPHTSLKGTG